VLTNEELSKRVDTSDEWIRTRTGIRERRIAGPDEQVSTMGTRAAQEALKAAGLSPADIDLLIVATITPDLTMPATACLIHNQLGLEAGVACFDLNAACSGFLYALDTACAMIVSGRYRHALVVGAEKLSGAVDWTDRSTCVLFGDGAGAAVVGMPAEPGRGLIGTCLGTLDGTDLLWIPAGGSQLPATAETLAAGRHCIQMKGREIFKLAVRVMDDAARDILEQHQVKPDQISCVIPHQANLRIIEAIAQYLELPLERFFINLDRYGNTSAASIPIALDEASRAGRIKKGDLLLLVAFGAGLTYGSALIRW